MAAGLVRVLDVYRWLRASKTEAARVLPELLDLSGPDMSRELARRPELVLGVIQLLLPLLETAGERQPHRVRELTEVLVKHAKLDVPPLFAETARYMEGTVWAAHASALRALQRYSEAREAVSIAYGIFREEPMSAWHVATTRAIEAEILHDLRGHPEALRLIREAAPVILLHGDRQRYVRARMSEAFMLCDTGDPRAAAEVWKAVADEAMQRGDRLLMAWLNNTVGVFELDQHRAEAATRHFKAAIEAFAATGHPSETARARRNLARALTARGRRHEAISEAYIVQSTLLESGDAVQAAIATIELVDRLFLEGRHAEVASVVESACSTLAECGLRPHALQAWAYLRAGITRDALNHDEILIVGHYLEVLLLQPNAQFSRTEIPL